MAALTLLAKISLSHEIEKYGAYAGWAAVLGLAVLSVLYFAQAREVRRLRDWAGRAPERDAELEARVTSQADEARRTPAVRPAEPPRRPPPRGPRPPPGGALPRAAPAGAGPAGPGRGPRHERAPGRCPADRAD